MAGCRSATKASSWLTAPSTSCGRSRRPRLSRTSGSAPFSPLSASSRLRGRSPAARRHRADAINATRDCSKSAELLYEPSERRSLGKQRVPLRGPCGGRRSGAALRTGSAPARRPNPATVTFLNGRNSDISKWWTHAHDGASRATFLADAASYAERFRLTAEQREALIALDTRAIVAMGAHPLVPFLANMQVDRQRRG